jgi:ribonuclease P protein component
MLPKSQRLSRRAFEGYFRSGRRYHSDTLTVVYTPHTTFKAAVVVAKKVAKQAHERNTIRRRLYTALAHFKKNSQTTGVYIVLTKPAVADLTRLEQPAALESVLSQIPK